MVLRRPPEHLRKNSNDTMLREARVLAALAGSGVPHPGSTAVCDDIDVIGTSFYLMEPIDGFTPMGPLPGRTPPTRLAAASRTRWPTARRARRGRPRSRRAGRLRQAGQLARTPGRPLALPARRLLASSRATARPTSPTSTGSAQWLDAHRPAEARIGVIHGDYQFANVMFAPRPSRSSRRSSTGSSRRLGDPLLDLGWMLTSWHEPGDPPGHGPAAVRSGTACRAAE